MDSYYMEPISHFIDYKIDFVKQLHPEYAIEINETYVLIIPFYAYNTFSDFKLIRLTDLNEVDLFEIPMIKEINNDINFFIDNTDFNGNNILLVGNYEFSCENLFSVKQKKPLEINKSSNLKSLIPIKGNYFEFGVGGVYQFNKDINIGPTIAMAISNQFGQDNRLTHMAILFPLTYTIEKVDFIPSLNLHWRFKSMGKDAYNQKGVIVHAGIQGVYRF